jgi:hypothetical protein
MSLFSRSLGPRLTLGATSDGLFPRPYTLPPPLVATHKHVIGLSGSGKSTLLAAMAVALIRQNVGVAVIDPHADLVQAIMAGLVDARFFEQPGAAERLRYIDFTDENRHLPFNVLKQPHSTPDRIAQEVNEVCQRAWTALAGGAAPQFENIVLAAVTVLAANGLTLTQLQALLTDREYREALLARGADPHIVDFFHGRFDRWGREQPGMLESTLRRIFLLTFSPTLRYCLGQPDNALDFRALLDSGTSVLVNLGGLEDATRQLLGCLLTVGFEKAALARATLAPARRAPYHLILDEFASFSAQSEQTLGEVLSQCRKYGLFLTLAHQTWSQLSGKLAGALQNTVEIAFRLGHDDARWAAPRFGSFDPSQAKQVGADGRDYPLSVQETFEGWADALERLGLGQAYVAVNKQTTRIRVQPLRPTPAAFARAQALCAGYNAQLLVPRDQVTETIDTPAGALRREVRRLVADDDAA